MDCIIDIPPSLQNTSSPLQSGHDTDVQSNSELGCDLESDDTLSGPTSTTTIFQRLKTQLFATMSNPLDSRKITADPTSTYQTPVGPFYLVVTQLTCDIIRTGKKTQDQVPLDKRFITDLKAFRVVGSDIENDGTMPPEAYESFIYCSLTKSDLQEENSHNAILCITPNNTDGIFIMDSGPAHNYSRKLFEDPTKYVFTNAEYYEFRRREGRTIIPIDEYVGDYEEPIVLIKESRKLSFDEVEIVQPHENPCSIQ